MSVECDSEAVAVTSYRHVPLLFHLSTGHSSHTTWQYRHATECYVFRLSSKLVEPSFRHKLIQCNSLSSPLSDSRKTPL